ncbi:hypothetical protein [Asticcacaulis solisilvae]|uniref:hypothetical protein n=1 Tax=Asticcacaulis solisilvae TaxID=1217274 RepID=UPI003FD7CC8C
MNLSKRFAVVAVCVIGLGQASLAHAELSAADADRYLTARTDIARLKDESTRAFQDAQARYNAGDVAGACTDLQSSADKLAQMAAAEDVIISLSGDNAGSAQLHKDEQASQIKARETVLATMARICSGTPATGTVPQ